MTRPTSCTDDVVEDVDLAGPRIDGDVRGMGAVAVGVPVVEEGALDASARPSSPSANDLPSGPLTLSSSSRTAAGFAAEPLGAGFANRGQQFLRGIEQGRAAHHGRARVIGAEALAHIGGRAVIDVTDALDRISSASAAICAKIVSIPWPTEVEPI